MTTLTQITLDADGTIGGAIDHDAGTGTPFYTHCNDAPNGGSSDYVQNDNSETTGEAWFSLSDVDTDFGSMDTLDIDVDVWGETAVSNDTITLTARIYAADNDTANPLTAETANLATGADTTRTQRNVSFGTLTGTKAQWNAAYIRFTWTYNKTGGPDNANLRLYGCDIDGTYTVAAATLEGALSLAATAGITHASDATAEGSAALDAGADITHAADATGEGAATLQATAGVTVAGTSIGEATLTLTAATGITTAGEVAIEVALALGATAGTTMAAQVTAESGLALAATGGLVASGVVTGAAAIGLAASLAIVTVGEIAGGAVTLEAALALGATGGLTAGSVSVADGALSLGITGNLTVLGGAAAIAALTLPAITGISISGAIVTITVSDQVAPDRTIVVTLEVREVAVSAEQRTIFVKDEGT